jgi:hypothetical protein
VIANLTTPQVSPDLIWRLLDDNAVVVSPGVGEVRVFNQVGTVIWQLLVEENSPGEIEDYLVTHYEVSHERAKSDLQLFINDLTDRGVLIWEEKIS